MCDWELYKASIACIEQRDQHIRMRSMIQMITEQVL